MKPITESHIESLAIENLQALGWEYIYGVALAPGAEQQERESYEQIILTERLRKAVSILNPHIPHDAQEQAVQKVLRIYSPDLLHNNETFHSYLLEGVKIPYQQDDYERSYEVALIDFENAANNEFVVINQYTITEKNQTKRPDVLLFVNGLPLVLMELKNAASEKATIERAYNQIQTYQAVIPSLFTYNAFCIISDGFEGKAGTITSSLSRYMVWKSADGIKDASRFAPQLEVMIKGMLNHATLLDLIRNFIVFEKSVKSGTGLKRLHDVQDFSSNNPLNPANQKNPVQTITQIVTEKKIAAYHQYFAVNKAVESTVTATSSGTKKGGVVWHTQGSGKSLSMVFYAGKIITRAQMQNPTLVVITDRNDLDDQLFSTFASCRQLLRQEPVQAESREKLKYLLKVASGGIVFTTIQKFLAEDGKETYDLLSERSNIIMIADEAHRTQYGFEAKLVDVKDANKEVTGKRIAYGFAKYMRDALPNATYIGFTGTPIESTDVNTPQVFGQYIDIYDIAQAVNDGATVKIWYESRLAKVNLDEEGRRLIEEFDKELEQNEEINDSGGREGAAKSKWTRLEAIVGNKQRIKNLAKDIVTHFEIKQSVFEGKGMIVAMSRRIAAELYNAIIALKPEWHSDDPAQGAIKVIMTATSDDGPLLSKLKTTKQERKDLAERMKDPADPLKLVIVRDMWLTGFDAPCLHTLYIDKPMRGHNLMQAIARVNRVFKDKPGGLVVDYLGIATDLKKALSFYSDAGGKGEPTDTQERAVEMLLEKVELVRQLFAQESSTKKDILLEEPLAYYSGLAGFNYNRFFIGAAQEKLAVILQAEEHILGLPDGKERFVKEVTLLSQAFALSVPDEEALALKDEIAFFQAVKSRLTKFEGTGTERSNAETDSAIKQIVDEALSSDQVVDIFDAAGIRKPEISVLSDEFMLEIKGMKHKNLALELLKKILNDEIKTRAKTNLVKSRALLEMLESSIRKYQNNLLTTAEIIQELIHLAKQITESDKEAERLGLSTEEVAFYNALEVNESAVQVLGDEQLRLIAREIAEKVKANATIDWTIRESARAKLMVLVKRTLNKYGYPPDMQQKAIETVLKQAELLAEWHMRF